MTSDDPFMKSFVGAVITDIGNGNMGLESFITIFTRMNEKYMISISNNNRFIITKIQDIN